MYAGSYLALAALSISSIIFLFFFQETKKTSNNQYKTGRSFLELMSQPRFLQALVASAFAYAVMTFLMTATPISMHTYRSCCH